jgi:hypothetical protein
MSRMLKIGPRLQVNRDGFVPNMQDAYETDMEWGSHALNNYFSEKFARDFPTIMAMAWLVEEDRDSLKRKVAKLERQLKATKKGQQCSSR